MELNQSSSPAAAVKEASRRLWRSGLPACGAAADWSHPNGLRVRPIVDGD